MSKVKTIIILGKPCSGKGTQARLLSKITGFKVYSMGDVFRKLEKSKNYVIAKKITFQTKFGKLKPAWLASFLFMKELLSLSIADGIIFDGICRTKSEAIIFHRASDWLGRPYKVFCLEIDNKEVWERLAHRKKTEKRKDDIERIMRLRLSNYHKEWPAIRFFKQKKLLIKLNGERQPQMIAAEIAEHLN